MKLKKVDKRYLYGVLIVLVAVKMFSFYRTDIYAWVQGQNYQYQVQKYPVLASYQVFKEKEKDIDAIYFGSVDCPSCVSAIKETKDILKEVQKVQYFKVDFNDAGNEKELDRFKKAYGFETIPHILIFNKEKITQYHTQAIYQKKQANHQGDRL